MTVRQGQRLLREAFKQLLRHGLSLDGRQLKPARVEVMRGKELQFTLNEGRNRQIRRMCELVGLKVVGLKRVRIGRVGDLAAFDIRTELPALGAPPGACPALLAGLDSAPLLNAPMPLQLHPRGGAILRLLGLPESLLAVKDPYDPAQRPPGVGLHDGVDRSGNVVTA